jgi:hypothetical protein
MPFGGSFSHASLIPPPKGEGGRAQRGRVGARAFEIAIDVIVPKPQRPESFGSEVEIALNVTTSMTVEIMLTSINFHNETPFEADKIHDKIVAWRLATKVKPTRPP